MQHGVEHHAVDGEVAAEDVFLGTGGEADLGGWRPSRYATSLRYVATSVTNSCPSTSSADQNDAEVGSDGKGAGEQGEEPRRDERWSRRRSLWEGRRGECRGRSRRRSTPRGRRRAAGGRCALRRVVPACRSLRFPQVVLAVPFVLAREVQGRCFRTKVGFGRRMMLC